MTHPVVLEVPRPIEWDRLHVFVRFAVLLALGSTFWTSLYWILYVVLPVVAGVLLLQKGHYFTQDAPRIVHVLRWLAQAYAYLWMLTDQPPSARGGGIVVFEVDVGSDANALSALLRWVTSLPALVLLAALTCVAAVVWVIGAVAVLATGELPEWVASFLEMTLRYRMRFLAYHLSLVQAYPSLHDSGEVVRSEENRPV
jgi:hypothetical protein